MLHSIGCQGEFWWKRKNLPVESRASLPDGTGETPVAPPTRSVFQQLPRNHHPLNFACPFANRAQLYVAIKLLRRIILDEPIPAVDLHTFIGAPHCYLAGVKLGHRGFHRGLLASVF